MTGSHRGFAGGVVRLNARIDDLASEEGVDLADLHGAFAGNEDTLLGDDGLHPTQAGIEEIAGVFNSLVK